MRWERLRPGRHPGWRLVGVGFLSGVLVALVPAGLAVRAQDARAAEVDRVRGAALTRVALRLDTLQSRLGGSVPGAPAGAERAGFEQRYQALVAGEVALAGKLEGMRRAIPSIAPVEGGEITSGYSFARIHPVLRRVRPHWGVDIDGATGDPVRATADGRVRAAGRHREYGLYVDVEHGQGFLTRYGHLSRIEVRRGDVVARGTVIGRVGQTGLATGSHLHYEVYWQGKARDPIRFLPPVGVAGGASGA